MRGAEMQTEDFWTPEYWRRYCESGNVYRRYNLVRDQSLATSLLRLTDGTRVLEVGCGYGRISRALLASARIRLMVIDRSNRMLATWKTTGPDSMPCLGDALRLPIRDEAFDAVLCSGVLMHVEDQRQAMDELVRVLRPGGRIVISGNNILSPFALPVAAWMFARRAVRQTFKSPWFYLRHLAKRGVEVEAVVANTLLAQGMKIPGTAMSLLPSALIGPLRRLDRLADRPPFSWLGYETWIAGVKREKRA